VSRKREEQSAVEAFWALGAPGPKKRLKRPDGELGLGGKGAENGPPWPPFSATFSQVRRLIRLYSSLEFNEMMTAIVTDSSTCGLGIGLGGAALAHTGLSFVPSGPASSLFLL
jgi:hypothetical protein